MLTIDLPWHAKSIDDNAETRRPKRGLKRKTDSAALGQLRKYLVSARRVFHRECDKETLRLDVVRRQQIGAVQLDALRLQSRVHDAVMPSRINLMRHRRLSVGEHRRKRTAEDPLVGDKR